VRRGVAVQPKVLEKGGELRSHVVGSMQ
jgi:hypothetical protein